MARTRIVRLLRRTLFVSAVAVSGLVATAPIAGADPCPVLDLGCVLEDMTTTVGGVLEDTTTTVGGVLEDTTTTVGGVLEDTTTTVGGVLEDTTTTVGGVLDGDGPIDPGPIVDGAVPGVIPGNGGALPGGGNTPPSGGGTTPGGGAQTIPPSSGTQGGSERGSIGVVRDPGSFTFPPTLDVATTTGLARPAFLDDRSGGSLLSGARLVQTFAFPMALILLVIGFVFVQNRIDRKDPKLALAPVGSDYLSFS